jgi:hypothetical protein
MRESTLSSFVGSTFSIGKLNFVGQFCCGKVQPEILVLEVVLALVVEFILCVLGVVLW